MQKLSVIIPTIQKCNKVLNKLLKTLDNDKIVDEIILINNEQKEFIPKYKIKKLIIHNQEKNLYVNPSWNYGIKNIKNDYFLIINDDILCPKNFCSLIINSKILDKDDTGLVGLFPGCIKNFTKESEMKLPLASNTIQPEFKPFDHYMSTGNWGSAFFGRKDNYYEIPDIFKIIYGDNYLLKQNLDAGKKNYFIMNLVFHHMQSTSSGDSSIVHSDINDIGHAAEYFGEDALRKINLYPVSLNISTSVEVIGGDVTVGQSKCKVTVYQSGGDVTVYTSYCTVKIL